MYVTWRTDQGWTEVQVHSPEIVFLLFASVSTKCTFSLSAAAVVLVRVAQGSPLSNDTGSPISFASIGSYAMGSVGTVLVYVRCVRARGRAGGRAEVPSC